jgi:hypothetical protein
MKRLLALLLLIALIGTTSATSLNFQNPGDIDRVINVTAYGSGLATITWVESTSGLNNYMRLNTTAGSTGVCMINSAASATTYAAATKITAQSPTGTSIRITLFDGSKNIMQYWGPNNYQTLGVYEVKIVGGTPKYYVNGNLANTGAVIAQNPSYVGFCEAQPGTTTGCGWDNFVYGDSENKLVLALPESDNDAFIILDDFVNDANDGLYNTTSGTQANANDMTSFWSRGNSSVEPSVLENQSVTLKHYDTDTIYWTGYTGTAYSGTFTIPIKTDVIDAGAPDGYYVLTSPGTFSISNMILKRSLGATVAFDKEDYSIDDKATVTWDVQTGDYWDTSLYSYRVFIRDLYGVEKVSYAVTERTGSFEYLFNSADDPGVYIAVITATPRAGGSALYIGTDYATLSEYGVITGYVKDGTGNAISGANVTFEQGSYTSVGTSGYDGNFTTLPFFITGTELTCNITATGHRQHYYTILPRSTKTKNINFTLPIEPTPFTGLGIDGVAMEGYLTPGTINIINGYGNPIPFATVNVTNTTTMESYSKTASETGWYMCDIGASCDLVFDQTYDVEGSKVGYQNSSIYQKKPYGVLT